MHTDRHGWRRIGGRLLPILPAVMLLTALPVGGAEDAAARNEVAPELLEKPYLYEVVRHLYRWYMDESDVAKVTRDDTIVFWVGGLYPKLDEGDHSQLGMIVLPEMGIAVKVKKADYTIEELDTVVKSDGFKIVNVGRRSELPASAPDGFREIKADYAEMRDYLFRTRNKLEFPEGAFLMSLRLAVREEILEDIQEREARAPDADPVIHFSSISPVANELWVFWEAGRLLLRVASDIDLANPAVWQHGEMAVELYDIDEQVVVSLDEVAGSNAYMTRDQVGRALFNCIVLGKRVVLEPLEDGE